jgi:hypothetical protein
MRRLTLSAIAVLLASPPAMVRAQEPHAGGFDCNRDIVRTETVITVPADAMKLRQPTAERRVANIILNAGATLSANAQALQAWTDAVALWETVLGDNVTVTINGDLAGLPSGVLGSTNSSTFQTGYAVIRDAMVADRSADENILVSVPTLAQLNVDLPNFPVGFSYDNQLRTTRAALSAMGFDMNGTIDPGGVDAEITFSTGFLPQFDFDPTDGITAGRIDFFAVVVHEIGHALGFTSAVDVFDYYVNLGSPISYGPTAFDLFRLVPGQGASNFTGAARIQTHGGEVAAQTFYDGVTERRLSTGFYNGDNRQASHWRADEFSGVTIGIMDPTISSGAMGKLTNSDLRVLGLVGWDIVPLPDCNQNDIGDQFDIWDGVEQDVNLNGIPDSCEATPAPEVRNAVVTIAPNPFNPRTEIQMVLTRDAYAKIDVYDLSGRHVTRLADRGYAAGTHSVMWEGSDDTGRAVSSGVYFVMVDLDGEVQQHKVALVR